MRGGEGRENRRSRGEERKDKQEPVAGIPDPEVQGDLPWGTNYGLPGVFLSHPWSLGLPF